MSNMSRAVIAVSGRGKPNVSEIIAKHTEHLDTPENAVTNFMSGVSYQPLSKLETLKMVSASAIFGEPQYYRDGNFAKKTAPEGTYQIHELCQNQTILDDKYANMTTGTIFEKLIDEALDEDFLGTLHWAMLLRSEYNMRLNPQVIMVRAAIHPARPEFNKHNPGTFRSINKSVMTRADDAITQLTYYLYINGSKRKLPNILKRSWAEHIEAMSLYEMAKYRNHGIGIIDLIRISHACNGAINQLLRDETIVVKDSDKSWERRRSEGESWTRIMNEIWMPYMALLRNLRGIFMEIDDVQTADDVVDRLIKGVDRAKQYPYRYLTAMNAISDQSIQIHHRQRLLDGLELTMDKSVENLPKLNGRSAFLSDNSGSAWGQIPSEYGSVTVAEIGNLSAVIGAVNSDEGYVFPFGDRLNVHEISKREGILRQAKEISANASTTVGANTENGIWLFFKDAIDNHIHWDNIFIYSDQQAGHGGLYGLTSDSHEYIRRGFRANRTNVSFYDMRNNTAYIDVMKLIAAYRAEVNPKVNVFVIQTAGYTNVLVPENTYRTSILYGWTGKELVYADAVNQLWDDYDKTRQARQTEPMTSGQ